MRLLSDHPSAVQLHQVKTSSPYFLVSFLCPQESGCKQQTPHYIQCLRWGWKARYLGQAADTTNNMLWPHLGCSAQLAAVLCRAVQSVVIAGCSDNRLL